MDHCPLLVLLFPEGTTISKETLETSHSFCKENHLPPWNHVLHPRIRGLHACIENMQPSLNGIFDLTVVLAPFGPEIWENPKEMYGLTNSFFGLKFPREINFFLDYIPITKVPSDDNERLRQWLGARFALKESLLSSFNDKQPRNVDGAWKLVYRGKMIIPYYFTTLFVIFLNFILWIFCIYHAFSFIFNCLRPF